MSFKPILIVWGEPNSIFSEILIKSFKIYKSQKPIVLIGSKKLLEFQINYLNISYKKNLINVIEDNLVGIKKNKINIINIDYKFKYAFEKISKKSNSYIEKSFNKALKLMNTSKFTGMINGPISKINFLKKKFKGITEYLAANLKIEEKNIAMLIYNKNLAVCPITTHLPISHILKNLDKTKIINKVLLINQSYKKLFFYKPKIAICGLNPHCENFFKLNGEEKKIITPALNILKKRGILIEGPFSADTIFMKNLRKKYNVIVGMYHDQVLAPHKTIYNFDAINITLGLPFLRISPDHGPNYNMVGKSLSDPKSLINSIKFFDNIS